jgi:hypothetical protein
MKAAFLAVLTLRIAFWLERVSRRFIAAIPQAPAGKFDLVAARRELSLEQVLYAARSSKQSSKQPSKRAFNFEAAREYEFVPEDEYFRRVERLLETSAKS